MDEAPMSVKLVEGPAYRMYDPKNGRWIQGREACIDVLVRKARGDGSTMLGPLAIAALVRQWWFRMVFR